MAVTFLTTDDKAPSTTQPAAAPEVGLVLIPGGKRIVAVKGQKKKKKYEWAI